MSDSHVCPNCQAPLHGDFCYACGQKQKGIDRFLFTLLSEAFEDVFSVKSRAAKTLVGLLFRPGFLTNEYFAGRRARYVSPIRLYIITSILFFLVLSVVSYFTVTESINIQTGDEISTELNSGDAPQPAATPETNAEAGNSETTAQTDPAEEGVPVQLDLGEDRIDLPFLSEQQDQEFEALIRAQAEKAKDMAKNDTRDFVASMLELAPPVVFCLVPLFALLLKIFYLFRRRFYTEHLVLAVHNHCFLFVLFTLFVPLDAALEGFSLGTDILGTVVTIWVPVYMWLSLRNVYRQGRLMTTLKFVLLGFSYSVLLMIGIAIAIMIGVLTL